MTGINTQKSSWGRTVAHMAAACGAVLTGAVAGLPHGAEALVWRAAVLPAVVVGVAGFMLPALYVGAAALGMAPPARELMRAGGRALDALGIALLGLVPAFLFLTASVSLSGLVELLTLAVVGFSALVGLWVLSRGLTRALAGAVGAGGAGVAGVAGGAGITGVAGGAGVPTPSSRGSLSIGGGVLFLAWALVTLGIGLRMMVVLVLSLT